MSVFLASHSVWVELHHGDPLPEGKLVGWFQEFGGQTAQALIDRQGCLQTRMDVLCCRVEQDLSQFQLLTSNWLTTLTSANLLGLRRGSPPPGSVGNPGFPELPLTQPLVPSSCGLGSVATWCHQSLLSIWCTHFWFCPLVVLSIFILLNVDIY